MNAAEIAAIHQAAEAAGDVELVLALLIALRDEEFSRDVRALLRAPPRKRAVLRAVLRQDAPGGAAND